MTVKIIFAASEDIGSQDEPDPWASITDVSATRTATTVGVEDKYVKGQKAHITADVVLERGVERLLIGKNWVEAWDEIHDLWVYLHGIATAWREHPVLGKAGKTILKAIVAQADQRKDEATYNVRRSDVDLAEAWFVEPRIGSYVDRKAQRTYYDHEPEGDEIPSVDFRSRRWRPNLGSKYVESLSAELESWVATRVRLPWTSLDTKSRNTSDRTGPGLVEKAIDAVADPNAISRPEANAIAAAMIVTFDFYPPSITGARTRVHAGAVGARHVVEHFKLHPRIQTKWRTEIATSFLDTWQTATQELAFSENHVTAAATGTGSGSKRKAVDLSGTPGLRDLLGGWGNVADAYRELVTTFSKAALV